MRIVAIIQEALAAQRRILFQRDRGKNGYLKLTYQVRGNTKFALIEAIAASLAQLIPAGEAVAHAEHGSRVQHDGIVEGRGVLRERCGTYGPVAGGGDVVEIVGLGEGRPVAREAAKGAPFFAEVVIHFAGELVRIDGAAGVREEVIEVRETVSLDVGLGKEGQHLHGDGVHAIGGNPIAGQRQAGGGGTERIVDGGQVAGGAQGLAEVAGALEGGRQRGTKDVAAAVAGALIVAEEEGAVAENGSAEGAAELVHAKGEWRGQNLS